MKCQIRGCILEATYECPKGQDFFGCGRRLCVLHYEDHRKYTRGDWCEKWIPVAGEEDLARKHRKECERCKGWFYRFGGRIRICGECVSWVCVGCASLRTVGEPVYGGGKYSIKFGWEWRCDNPRT